MHTIKVAGHEFTTDGSRLVCDNSFKRTIDYIKDFTQEEVKTLASFIQRHMTWMNTSYDQGQLNEVRDSIHPIFEGNNEDERNKALKELEIRKINFPTGEEVTAYANFPNNPKLDSFNHIPEREYEPEFIHSLATIYHASSPYLWDYDFGASIDGFYIPFRYPQEAYAARNKKEFITNCFGSYISSFPDMNPYMFSSLFAAFPNKKTPIEYIAEIAKHFLSLEKDYHNSIEYLPFVMNTPQIQLTAKRLIHWFRQNDPEDVTLVLAQLVEIHDMPYVETVSANGSFKKVQEHCDRMLNLGIERMHENQLEQYKNILEIAQGKVATFNRKPDANFDKYAIYMVRSAIELADLGNNLEVCLGGPMYARRLEEKEASFFVIEGENRQYVAHIENGEIKELRGWKNHSPKDKAIIDAAHMCKKELVGA